MAKQRRSSRKSATLSPEEERYWRSVNEDRDADSESRVARRAEYERHYDAASQNDLLKTLEWVDASRRYALEAQGPLLEIGPGRWKEMTQTELYAYLAHLSDVETAVARALSNKDDLRSRGISRPRGAMATRVNGLTFPEWAAIAGWNNATLVHGLTGDGVHEAEIEWQMGRDPEEVRAENERSADSLRGFLSRDPRSAMACGSRAYMAAQDAEATTLIQTPVPVLAQTAPMQAVVPPSSVRYATKERGNAPLIIGGLGLLGIIAGVVFWGEKPAMAAPPPRLTPPTGPATPSGGQPRQTFAPAGPPGGTVASPPVTPQPVQTFAPSGPPPGSAVKTPVAPKVRVPSPQPPPPSYAPPTPVPQAPTSPGDQYSTLTTDGSQYSSTSTDGSQYSASNTGPGTQYSTVSQPSVTDTAEEAAAISAAGPLAPVAALGQAASDAGSGLANSLTGLYDSLTS